MKRFLIIIIIVLLVVSVFVLLSKRGGEEEEKFMPDLSNKPEKSSQDNGVHPANNRVTGGVKKVLMIIAFEDFKDEEYFKSRAVLEEAGTEIKVVSDNIGTAKGVDGGEVSVDFELSKIDVSQFDSIVFIGGPGALRHLDNDKSYKIVREAVSQNKVLAAICISPAILAKAGVLKGKKATVWTSPLDKNAKKILEDNGAIYQDEKVVVGDGIITGNGPAAAEEFGQKIVEALFSI